MQSAPEPWREGWIPLGRDHQGQLLVLDLDPGVEGTTGQIFAVGTDDPVRHVLAKSWAQFLEDVANEPDSGQDLLRPPGP